MGSASGPPGFGELERRPTACWRSWSLSPDTTGSEEEAMRSKSGQPSELGGNRSSCGTGDQAAKARRAAALVVVALVAAFACGGGSSDSGSGQSLTGPSGGGDQVTWTFDGTNLQASSNGMSAT